MKKNQKHSSIPPTKPSKSFDLQDKEIIPVFLTNTVTNATYREKGNTPIPSEYAVLEAKKFSRENSLS